MLNGFQLDYILTIECVLPSCLRRFFVYENKKQRVVIKEKHPIIPILCALVGDMTFRLADKPTTEVSKYAAFLLLML